MGYVIAAILVVLLVSALVFFLVTNATKKSNVSDAGDPGADQNPLGIIGSDDDTPMGDTTEHAGEQNESGETVGGQDAEEHGGTGEPPERSGTSPRSDRPDVARPVVGGEAEGERSAP
jgi:hypothetical protein